MTSFIAADGSGRSTSVIPAVPAASSVTTIAFIQDLPVAGPFMPPADGRSRPPSAPRHRHRSFPHRRVFLTARPEVSAWTIDVGIAGAGDLVTTWPIAESLGESLGMKAATGSVSSGWR